MEFTLFGDLVGGIGLFLLGMHLMTQGLRKAAGPALKQILRSATRSHWRGLASGTLITALVQSSSAVTVATIGFVNAGLLSLSQSVAVIYGCNIGTTMTGWLIALIGFRVQISAFALPLIGLGMLLQLVGDRRRLGHLGFALTGFGVFFIGLGILKDAFAGLEQHIDLSGFDYEGIGLLLFLLAGFALTTLMQASAAAMAVTLSLTASGVIPLAPAAAMIIGANVGTTSTAMIAVIGATANAKRIAGAHVLFNLLTGAVGVLLLMLLSSWLNRIDATRFDLVILLAVFHSTFNLMGVALLWPLTDRLVAFLKQRFRTQEEDEGRARFLDDTLLQTPTLAVEAVAREIQRLDTICSRMAREAVGPGGNTERLQAEQLSVDRLVGKIGGYCQKIAENDLSSEVSIILPTSLRIARYLNEVSRLACRLPEYWDALTDIADPTVRQQVLEYRQASVSLIDACEISAAADTDASDAHRQLNEIEEQYQSLKGTILQATTARRLKPDDAVALLDALSHIHRLDEQAGKVSSYWSGMIPLQRRQPSVAAGHA
ncbi:hypothetical protein GCM10011348_45510 [Marinobacterium nitratireducens]|uniref:Sodium-dependent phosphate transporter n=1 Tax=Marinobacterium nitratireducens TaxID=518897 RepID=A0A917ZRY3_9GAMM|nr:Na/Pi symporter [Marinobacterium nitratireducens]GGO88930.1 hypothetical protein GCM10011348_45510 [Marinobacterium nitratireducens]